MTNTANKPLDWYAERTAYLTEFMSEERRQVLQRTLDSRTRYMTDPHRKHLPCPERQCAGAPLRSLRHTGHPHRRDPLPVQPQRQYRAGHGQMDRPAPPPHYVRSDRRPEGAGLSHRGDHASPRRRDSRNVRCRGLPLRAGLRHRARRHLRTRSIAAADEFLRIPMCGMVESLNVSASAAILIYMLSSRMRETVPDWRLTAGEQAEIALSLDLRLSVRDAEAILATQISRRIRKTMNTILRKQFLAHVGQTSPEPDDDRSGAGRRRRFSIHPKANATTIWWQAFRSATSGIANPARGGSRAASRPRATCTSWSTASWSRRPQVRVCRKDRRRCCPGRVAKRLFRQFGRRSGRRGSEAGQTLYAAHGAGLACAAPTTGRRTGAMSMMGAPEGEEWKGAFRPLLPDVRAIDFNDFDRTASASRAARPASLVEPVQGEAGVRTAGSRMAGSAAATLRRGRVRCSFSTKFKPGWDARARCSPCCKYGVTPDIVCLAKAFGGGHASRSVRLAPRDHGHAAGKPRSWGTSPPSADIRSAAQPGLAALNYLLDNQVGRRGRRRRAHSTHMLLGRPSRRA